MKIVFLSFYSGLVDRGVETFVEALASRLGKKHEVLVIQAGKKRPSVHYTVETLSTKMSWPEVDATGWQRTVMIDYFYRKIASFTRKSLQHISHFNPDIIVPANGGWQTLMIKLYCLKTGKRMVISGQAGLGRDERWNLLVKPDLYVALTQRNLKWAQQYAPNQKIVVIPNGVDLRLFRSHPDTCSIPEVSQLRLPRILCVAGPESYKRVESTIEAVSKIPEASLIVAGGNENTRKLGKRLLGERFLQVKVAHQQIPQLYSQANVFTLVSKPTEAFGIAYVEALASNLPVVAPDDSLRREIIGEAGVYVKNPRNAAEYALKLEEALKTKWETIPRKQAEKYDWDMISLEYEQQFNRLLSSQ